MKFSFYTVDARYCDFLRKTDSCVPYTMDRKYIRPFVGIIFSVNGFHYYAPLTSPKPKHLHMKSQIDFLKIKGGEWGAINFNNMIPVPLQCLTKVEIRILEGDTKADSWIGFPMSKTREGRMEENNTAMIEEIMRHLDAESAQGVCRMSVTFDEDSETEKTVSHKCCNVYGRPATEVVGLLDMYTDMNAGKPDRQG